MKTALFVVSIALLACAFAQDCNNPLLAAFNLTGLDQPQTVQGLNWCSNLQNGQSCCSSDTVDQFQSLLQDLVNSLEDEAGSRDQVLVGFRNNLLDRYQDAVSDLTDNDDQLTRLTNANAAVGNEVRSEWSRFSNITDLLSDLDDDDLNDSDQNDDTDDENDFFIYLQNLQVARSTCLEKILDVQSSLWCLACDPNWASQGVNSNGTVTVSQQLADDITSSCYNYTVWSQRFNPLLIANQTYQRVQNLNNYLRSYGNDNSILQSANVSNDVYSPTNANEQTVVLPPNCSNTTCNWQTILLLSSGSINQSIAANGAGWLGGANALLPNIIQGNVVNSSAVPITISDLISNTSAINLVVQGNSNNQTAWSPANNISGLPVAITGDPAQVSGLQDNALPTGVTGALGGAVGAAAGAGAASGNNNNNSNNTDNDGIDTDNTDNDGINTDANDVTDNDGINTDANDPTDNDNDRTDNNNDRTDNNNNTDNDGNNTDTDNN